MTPAELLDSHPHATVLTLDFFDTLVTRSVAQPTHVFAVMEERLVSSEPARWHGFALHRVMAERRARSVMSAVDEHSDITLDHILRELASRLSWPVRSRSGQRSWQPRQRGG
jgi:hypothetical protein